MIGTASFQPNVFDRLANAWRGFKALPTPSQLYPPGQQSSSAGYIAFPGWAQVEKDAGQRDERNVRKALQSPTVFANVQAIANEIASAELIIKERVNDGLEDVDNHPLELLWEAPNPHMGRSFLMSYWAWSYTLSSRAYLYWLPAGGEIQEVWPIPPFMIRPLPSGKDFIGGYAFKARPETDPILIPTEYITYSHSVNLFDVRDGLSFLAAAMVDINSEVAEALWNQNFFDEGNGVPDGLITVGRDTLDSDLIRIRSELRDFFGGTRRGVAVARAGDMDWSPFGRSQKDVEFKEGLALAAQRIGRAMGFPDGYWSDIANKANAEAARATMIAGAVWPLLVRLHEDLNAGVVRRWYGEQYRAEFKDIRPEDRALKLQELTFYAQIETLDELRKRIGADEIGDVRGMMLLAEIAKGIATPTSAPSQETEDILAEQEAEQAEEEPIEEETPPEAGPPAQAPPIGEAPASEEAPAGGGGVPEGAPMKADIMQPHKTWDINRDGQRGKLEAFIVVSEAPEAAPVEGEAVPVKMTPGLIESLTVIDTAAAQQRTRVFDDAARKLDADMLRDGDIARWRGKATKALRAGKSAAVKFESASIPADEHARISAALRDAQTATDVAQAFKATDETDALIDAEWDGAVEWAKAAKGDGK